MKKHDKYSESWNDYWNREPEPPKPRTKLENAWLYSMMIAVCVVFFGTFAYAAHTKQPLIVVFMFMVILCLAAAGGSDDGYD